MENAQKGKKVGWICTYTPEELIYAAGFTPTRLFPGDDQNAGGIEDIFPNSICPFVRQVMNEIRSEAENLEGLVIANSCNAMMHLYNALNEEFNGFVYLLDVPAINSEEAVNYLAEQLGEICGELEKQTGIKLSEEKIKEVFSNVNEARQFQEEANLVRQKYPDIISGDESLGYVYLYFIGSGHGQTGEVWKTLTRELNERTKNLQSSVSDSHSDKVRLIWLHLRPYHSSELVSYLENDLNVSIAMEEVNFVYWPPLDPEKPFTSIAKKIMANPGLGPLDNRLETIVKMVNDYKADGVLHFSHWGCRHSVGGTVMLKKHLRRKGIPFLALDGDCIDGSSFPWGQVRTRVDSFYELIQQ